jgi:hypothetical protein
LDSAKQRIRFANTKLKRLTSQLITKLESNFWRPESLSGSPQPLGPAGLAVFTTCELAEEIFSYLKMEELIWATQVCHPWHSIILTSKLLRKRLLHEPMNAGCTDMYVPAREGEAEAQYIHHNSLGHGEEGYWFERFEALSFHKFSRAQWYNGDGKVIIYRTPELHIELFVQYELDQEPPLLAPHRTRVTELIVEGKSRRYQGVLEGFDRSGEVAWRSVYMRMVSDHWWYIVHNLGESM